MRKTKPGIGTEYQSYMNEIHHKMKIKKIENEKNREFVLQLNKREPKDFTQVFKGANPHAVDLL